MKLRTLTAAEASALVDELRAMANLPPGINANALRRAKEIRFQLQGQAGTTPSAHAHADDVYRDLEVLLHPHRWKSESSLETFRKQIKSSCDRLRVHLGLKARPSG